MRAILRTAAKALAAAALVGALDAAETLPRQGRSPSLLVIDAIEAASGADPGTFGGFLLSDVQTLVEQTIDGADGDGADDLQRRRPGDVPTHPEGSGRPAALGGPVDAQRSDAQPLSRRLPASGRAQHAGRRRARIPFDGAVTRDGDRHADDRGLRDRSPPGQARAAAALAGELRRSALHLDASRRSRSTDRTWPAMKFRQPAPSA